MLISTKGILLTIKPEAGFVKHFCVSPFWNLFFFQMINPQVQLKITKRA